MGLRTYLVKGARGPKSKFSPSLFMQLSLLELEAYERERKDIQFLKEINASYTYQTVPYDIMKSSVLLFLNEVLYQVIREESANPTLFGFLYSQLCALDQDDRDVSDFHLAFLIRLSRHLGFFPGGVFNERNSFFNLTEGTFQPGEPLGMPCITLPLSRYFNLLIQSEEAVIPITRMNNSQRRELLAHLIDYYRIHLPWMGNIQSHKVLNTVFA